MIPFAPGFFKPQGSDYPGLITPILWLDAADNSTISIVEGGVDGWTCKITNTTWSAAAAGNRPVVSTDTYFNEQFINFDNDGTNKYLTGDSITASVPFTAFIIARWVEATGFRGFGIFSSISSSSIASLNGAPSVYIYSTISGSQNRCPQVNGSTTTYSVSPSTTSSAAGVYTYVVPTTTPADTVLEFLNSALAESASAGTYNSTFGFTTVGSTDSTYLSKGQIGEVLVYGQALSVEQRTIIHDYLAAKWLP